MRTSYQPHRTDSSARFAPIPDHICESRVREATQRLGGQMSGGNGRIPSPGKDRSNRSTALFPNPNVRFGVGVHCHDNPDASRLYRDEIAGRMSWDDGSPIVRDWKPSQIIVGTHYGFGSQSAKDAAREQKALERCKAVWLATVARGEVLEAYILGARGLSAACYGDGLSHAIRLHEALPYWIVDGENPDGSPRFVIAFTSPAMIARITDCVTGKSIGIHRTWLTESGRKNPLAGKNARKMKGKAKGGTVALAGPDAAGLIGVAEGIESALAMKELTGVGTHAALSTTGLMHWTPPNGTKAVLIAHDDDPGGQGKAAADALAIRLAAMGIESRHYPPIAAHRAFKGCNDWNDALLGKRIKVAA